MMVSEKSLSLSIWTENESIQIKNYEAAVSMMASFVFASLVRQVWTPLSYQTQVH